MSRLHIGKELFKKAKYEVLKLIATKYQDILKEETAWSIDDPKELWESLKYLGMPNKTVISNFNVMEDNVTLIYDTRSISTFFKIFFSSLAESLFVKLPIPPDKNNLEFALNYYFTFTTPDDFCFNNTSEKS